MGQDWQNVVNLVNVLFLNGRIDLSQAEAISDIITAKN